MYEGIQLYINRADSAETDFLALLGVDIQAIENTFCKSTGIYLHRMNDEIQELAGRVWKLRSNPDPGLLRFYTVRLLHALDVMPRTSEIETFFTRSQIAIVMDAERLILSDLSVKRTAKELAARYGVSESSFKQYVKGILGDNYLTYFRRKRMEAAAELLKTTDLKIIEIAGKVGYENQSKFAKVFTETYGMTPLEFRRMPEIVNE